MLEASICLSTFNKPHLLRQTLQSIYRQHPPFEFEVIVVDDGSADSQVRDICGEFPVRYHRIDREPVFRNPCVARNAAYRLARADIIIAQSDEVVHVTPNVIERLVRDLQPGAMLFAHVFCLNREGEVDGVYTGPTRKAPYFFLGSLYREDLYAVGGNDEDFAICPAWEDQWFADCLLRGRKLTPVFSTDIVGHHLWHEYWSRPETEGPSRDLYKRKLNASLFGGAPWVSSGGPWPFVPAAKETVTEAMPALAVEEKFTEIYRTSHWGADQESRSGAGSSLAATEAIRNALPRILAQRGVTTMLDLPCGDFHWMKHVGIAWINYIGGDVVRELVEDLRNRYADGKRTFLHLDLLSSALPRSDLILCRDCLQHLSFVDFRRAIANIGRSGATYLLATTFPDHHDNQEIKTGDWFPYNLQDPPFNFPEPVELINENCQEWHPHFADKSLGLWYVHQLTGREPIKSLTVCVDYDDFLAVTLPRNKRHFTRTLVVTSPADTRTQELARREGVECYVTDAFYCDGAAFNKGAAVEEAFDALGRDGWICVWDADIVMPDDIAIEQMDRGCLYTPARCLLDDPQQFSDGMDWSTLPVPTQPHEFDGYFQLFNGSAIPPPWYGTDWAHAGGCDSDFQFRFPVENRRRAPFLVLHMGTEGMDGTRIGRNWCGRVTPRIDTGEAPAEAARREADMRKMIAERKVYGTAREKIQPAPISQIPKRISFFWSGRMSWLRCLTLETFRRFNPDWEMRLYRSAVSIAKKTWSTPERDDSEYCGPGYGGRLAALNVSVHDFIPPVAGVAAAQASDLLTWSVLAGDGGFCADMDILWLQPMDAVWQRVANSDAVFCLEDGLLAVGFVAAKPGCQVFRSILDQAASIKRLDRYQCFGTELAYGAFKPIGRGKGQIGVRTIDEMRRRYRRLKIDILPDATVYPFNWMQIDAIFSERHDVPAETVGLHWFGGSLIAQQWIKRLTPENWRDYDTTLTTCLRKCYM